MTQDQTDWFNRLPYYKIGAEFERTCPCGATIRYEGSIITLPIESWVNLHFGHTEPAKPAYKFEYDLSRPIKFTDIGFQLFYAEFKLSPVETDGLVQIMEDQNGMRFKFYQNYLDEQFSEFKDLFVTYLPV